MRKWMWRLAILLAVVALVWVLRLTVFKPDPVPVTVAEVARGRVESTVTNSRAGTVRTRRRAKLSPELGGQVAELPFREGDRVAAGDVVLRLDDRAQQARLALARSEVATARAERERACITADRAGRELERSRVLAADELLSADSLDQLDSAKNAADAACNAARANEARAQAAVRVSQTELDKMTLRAPFAGLVAEVSIEVGEWTTPSPPAIPVPPVVDILDPSSIYVSAPMDEVDSARVRAGQTTRVTVDSHRDRSFSGRVSRVAPYVLDLEEQNRTVEIEVELGDGAPVREFLPGTSADVEVILEVKEDALRIPTSALMEGNRVLMVADGVLAERTLTTGLKNWDFVEVTSGLAAGDRIVTSLDRAEVKAGAEAEVVDAP
ncbi:MAG: efflux RND transporter periplasmic adaptor subunit [Acidobacteriota bacterium]|nr:efflux RND transporter periplasmic adaptor subunit [Acidobacteriota bacterium]MDH3522671.1 efflux RND transporter periplasmic adaptor subunit [Acidobacteriota bacterium]